MSLSDRLAAVFKAKEANTRFVVIERTAKPVECGYDDKIKISKMRGEKPRLSNRFVVMEYSKAMEGTVFGHLVAKDKLDLGLTKEEVIHATMMFHSNAVLSLKAESSAKKVLSVELLKQMFQLPPAISSRIFQSLTEELSIHEFLLGISKVKHLCKGETRLMAAFSLFDTDNSYALDQNELQNMLRCICDYSTLAEKSKISQEVREFLETVLGTKAGAMRLEDDPRYQALHAGALVMTLEMSGIRDFEIRGVNLLHALKTTITFQRKLEKVVQPLLPAITHMIFEYTTPPLNMEMMVGSIWSFVKLSQDESISFPMFKAWAHEHPRHLDFLNSLDSVYEAAMRRPSLTEAGAVDEPGAIPAALHGITASSDGMSRKVLPAKKVRAVFRKKAATAGAVVNKLQASKSNKPTRAMSMTRGRPEEIPAFTIMTPPASPFGKMFNSIKTGFTSIFKGKGEESTPPKPIPPAAGLAKSPPARVKHELELKGIEEEGAHMEELGISEVGEAEFSSPASLALPMPKLTRSRSIRKQPSFKVFHKKLRNPHGHAPGGE